MPRFTVLKNFTATLAMTAPVLAMVAGLATAHIIASATGITTQDSAAGDHPRRSARTIAMTTPDMAYVPQTDGSAGRAAARTAPHGDSDARVQVAADDGAAGRGQARILSRQ